MICRITDPNEFLGMEYGVAFNSIENHGYTVVLVKSDGITRMFIKDYDPLRVQLTCLKNKVIEVKIG